MKLFCPFVQLLLVIGVIFPMALSGQSTWIYGVVDGGVYTPAYLVRLDYSTAQLDTVSYLGEQYIDDFGCCIDPFNGRLFLSGLLFGQSGFLQEVSLNTLEIVSHDKHYWSRDMEYNFLNNSIIYRVDSSMWKVDLVTGIESKIADIEHIDGHYWGSPRSYNPVDNTFVFFAVQDDESYCFVYDAFTGALKSKKRATRVLYSLAIDFDSGKQYGIFNGTIYSFNPYGYKVTELLTIPDYKSDLNEQQAVYDQNNKKYIVPYIANNNQRKFCVIDLENYSIDTSFVQPNSQMNLHEIYCQPRTYLSMINDTLHSTYGSTYQWCLDGLTIPVASNQYYIPEQSGDYQVLVNYSEYASLSNIVSYDYTDLPTDSKSAAFKLLPNPFRNQIHIIGHNNDGNNFTLRILSTQGVLINETNVADSKIPNLEFLKPGFYLFVLEQNGKIILRQKMVKSC